MIMTEIISYADAGWAVPTGAEPDAGGRNLTRAPMAQGHGGFFSQVVDCPPDYVLQPHSHDHSELFIVLRGQAIVGERILGPYDTVAIPANEVYGVQAGPEGLEFMVVRNGQAELRISQ